MSAYSYFPVGVAMALDREYKSSGNFDLDQYTQLLEISSTSAFAPIGLA
jgi:hypothetical protein